MRKLHGFAIVSLLFVRGTAFAQTYEKEHVGAYTRKDGEEVKGSDRKKPNKAEKKPEKDTKATKKN